MIILFNARGDDRFVRGKLRVVMGLNLMIIWILLQYLKNVWSMKFAVESFLNI